MNYYTCCILACDNVELIGVGTGETPEGEPRICVALEGAPIHPHVDGAYRAANWIALTDECARELFHLLDICLQTLEFVHVTLDDGSRAVVARHHLSPID